MRGSSEAGAPAHAGTSRARAAGRAACASALWALVAGASAASAADLVAVRVGRHDGFTRVVLETDAPAPHRVDAPAGDRLVVELDARSPARSIASKSRHLSVVEVEPGPEGTRVRVDLRRAVDVRSFVLRGPDRVVVDLYDAGEAPGEATPVGRADVPQPAPAPAPGGRPPTPTPEDEGLVELRPQAPVGDPDAPSSWEQLAAQDRTPAGDTVADAPAPGAEPQAPDSPDPELVLPEAPPEPEPPGAESAPGFEGVSEPEAAASGAESAEAAELEGQAVPGADLELEPGMEPERRSELERAFPEPPAIPPPDEADEDTGPGFPLLLALLAVAVVAYLALRARRRRERESHARLAAAYADADPDLELDPEPRAAPSEVPPSHGTAPDDLPAHRGDFAAAATAAEPSLFDLPAAEIAGAPTSPTQEAGGSMEPYAPTHTSRPSATGSDSDRLLAELERRIAHLETRIEELADARERLERQVAAQTEELRVQRAAIARTQRVLRGMARPEDEASEPVPKT